MTGSYVSREDPLPGPEVRQPPWAPVYRVPDYVFFGHREHLAAGARCAECHGAVEARDAMRRRSRRA